MILSFLGQVLQAANGLLEIRNVEWVWNEDGMPLSSVIIKLQNEGPQFLEFQSTGNANPSTKIIVND